MKKDTKLYNVLFPIWFFLLFPQTWLLILPVNFIVDSLVLILSFKYLKLFDIKCLWKKSILKVFAIGFISDILGALLTLGVMLLTDWLLPAVNTALFPGTTIIALPGVILAGFLIYFLNKRFSFKKTEIELNCVKKICVYLAIFTAPYTMLIPLYG
ncbi:MAG: hypothetical protein MJ091_03045 [Clostridia bacterium]|nr:hypothetical protein [Clostridia bacterium]